MGKIIFFERLTGGCELIYYERAKKRTKLLVVAVISLMCLLMLIINI
jgi:hypothetical protein